MFHRFLRSLLAGLAVLAVSPGILAQIPAGPGSRPAKAKPDLSGVWEPPGALTRGLVDPSPALVIPFLQGEPSLTPWAEAKYKSYKKDIENLTELEAQTFDPWWNCFPPGPTRAFTIARPFEIRQFPDAVFLLFEWDHWSRRIYTDGRGHPDGYPITWMGHSIGKWDGDTLVADTIAVNDKTWLDHRGLPHSEALHIVERFRRVNQKTLEIEFSLDDPKAFTKPWKGKTVFELMQPGWEVLEHIVCEELLEVGKHR